MRIEKSPSCKFLPCDREFFEHELQSFVPDKIFDAHVHIGLRSDFGPLHADLIAKTPEATDIKIYQEQISWLIPERKIAGAVLIPNTLLEENHAKGNKFVAEQSLKNPEFRNCLVVSPRTAPEKLWDDIQKYNPVALKCYHLMASREPTLDSAVDEYLPDSIMQVADKAELPIILHLVRSEALADAGNQETICRYSRNYPNAKLVLAHAARGFNPSTVIRGLEAISKLDNVYFDVACATEGGAIEAIIRAYGVKRVMWGSDYVFSHLRGRCVAINDSFVWLLDNNTNLAKLSGKSSYQFTLVGLEALRNLKYACMNCRLNDTQIEDVFCYNALKIYGEDA
jgi:predicted TIM-barrel fold metal-dependent hydrolase